MTEPTDEGNQANPNAMGGEHQINYNVNPDTTPVYFVDSFLIGSNEHSVTLNFAQALFDGHQQQIVSRIAMTRSQAKEFLKTLNDHIEKYEL